MLHFTARCGQGDVYPPTEVMCNVRFAATGCCAAIDEPLAKVFSVESRAACKSHPNPAGTLPYRASKDGHIPRRCREEPLLGETSSVLASSVPSCWQECEPLRYDR